MEEKLKTNCYDTISKEIPVILPLIMAQGGRRAFRKAFIQKFPTFIHILRTAIPQITSGEEILCMLIYLNQSTEDIAAILGINRRSVNQSRYRLRLKANIPSSKSLDHFLFDLFNT